MADEPRIIAYLNKPRLERGFLLRRFAKNLFGDTSSGTIYEYRDVLQEAMAADPLVSSLPTAQERRTAAHHIATRTLDAMLRRHGLDVRLQPEQDALTTLLPEKEGEEAVERFRAEYDREAARTGYVFCYEKAL